LKKNLFKSLRESEFQPDSDVTTYRTENAGFSGKKDKGISEKLMSFGDAGINIVCYF
jgi:hypothetical protein